MKDAGNKKFNLEGQLGNSADEKAYKSQIMSNQSDLLEGKTDQLQRGVVSATKEQPVSIKAKRTAKAYEKVS